MFITPGSIVTITDLIRIIPISTIIALNSNGQTVVGIIDLIKLYIGSSICLKNFGLHLNHNKNNQDKITSSITTQ